MVPSVRVQHTPEGPLVAKFEPSIPPPPSAHTQSRDVASAAKSRLSDAEIDNLWVQVNNRRDSLIRSNPTHYWAWMEKNISDELKDVAGFQGQVVADAHYFNFGDVHGKDKSGLAVVDIDDSGLGSLYLDFVRYAIFVKAYLKTDLTKELFDAYTDGLKQKKKDVPEYLSGAISKSRKDLMMDHLTWVQKNLKKDYKLNNKELEITGFNELEKKSPEKVRQGKLLGDLLVKGGKAKKIYDIGYMVTDSGSSRGMDRFWFSLITLDNDSSIYECKQLSQPATAYYTRQKNHAARIGDVLKAYSDVETKDSYVFDTPNDSYWCRPKHFGFFGRNLVEDNRDKTKKMIEYSRYLAYWMGYKQSYQKDGHNLIKMLESDEKNIIADTVDLIIKYEDHVFKLGDKK